MTILNNLNKCDIFDKFLVDDLYSYSLQEDASNTLSMTFSNNQTATVNMRLAELKAFLPSTPSSNVWCPIFIKDDRYVNTKILTKDGAIQNANPALTSGRLGIEDFITFTPSFQNWNTSASCTMSIDWILNQITFPYSLQYGLLGWYKTLPITGADFVNNTNTIDKFPIGSRLKTTASSLAGVSLIKLDNNSLYRIDQDDSLINNSQNESEALLNINFNSVALVKVSDLGPSPTFVLSSPHIVDSAGSIFNTKSLLWISDGDFFSYFENEQDKTEQYANNIISQSYISAGLYSTYTQIYNIVTSHEPRNFDHGMILKKARLVKKLSFVLSTSPIMTDFGINALNLPEIRQYISDYINGGGTNTMELEISALTTAVVNIHQFLQKEIPLATASGTAITLGNNLSNQTLSNNLVYDRQQLFKKLLNKYSATLKLVGDQELTYKRSLKYGDSLYLSQITTNQCNKALTGSSNATVSPTTVFNNHTITLSSLNISTQIDGQNSQLNLQHNSKTKILPLSDIAKIPIRDFIVNIKMYRTTNVSANARRDHRDGETLLDWSQDNYIFETENINQETAIDFAIIGDSTDALASKSMVRWEQIEGPCLKFSDTNKTPELVGGKKNGLFDVVRYDYSTDFLPTIYVSKTGEYKIQCTISTPIGTFIKKKTFYVVNGIQIRGSANNPVYGQYAPYGAADHAISAFTNIATGDTMEGLTPPAINAIERLPLRIISDNLKIICPTLSELAIHRRGIFWPLKSNLQYETPDGTSLLEGTAKFDFINFDNTAVTKTGGILKLSYSTNNTIIKLLKITLKNIRNETEDCCQCLSLYNPTAYGYSTNVPGAVPPETRLQILRAEKAPDDLLLYRTVWSEETKRGNITKQNPIIFGYPNISTTHAPPIKTYGGYSRAILNMLGVNIKGHDFPAANTDTSHPVGVASNPHIIPSVTGYKLDYYHDPIPGKVNEDNQFKVCYQKVSTPSGFIEFQKGVFHPASGWIKYPSSEFDQHANLSSVLKFNPGARDSFSFSGPGLSDLKSSYANDFNNIPNIYKSAITLQIAPEIRWDPLMTCETVNAQVRKAHDDKNQLAKEYIDQYFGGPTELHHGYRYLAGGTPKKVEYSASDDTQSVDEFGFENIKSSCNPGDLANTRKVEYIYSFPVTGPSNKIGSPDGLRNPKINNLNIQDVEVKLNFLNYVNTKNLVIWLDVVACSKERNKFTSLYPGCPITAGANQFINKDFPATLYGKHSSIGSCANLSTVDAAIRHVGLRDYIHNLTEMNSTLTNRSEPIRLYLLNKEHIQNNKYNLSLKFSDHAPTSNVPFDQNALCSDHINLSQIIIQDSYELSPTTACSGYSDIESIPYQHMMKTNQINIMNNTFAKLKNKPLFITPPPADDHGCGDSPRQKDPTFDSSTSFILNIMVLDEFDEMRSYDMVNNNGLLSGYDSAEVKQRSADIANSLCSWELILHGDKTRKYTASNGAGIVSYGTSDALGLIEYGVDPKYPGYNFIADFSNKKYLIPTVNTNAPDVYINDVALCGFVDPVDKPTGSMLSPPEFPKSALMLILAGITSNVLAGGGSVMGALMGFGSSYYAGFSQIASYFYDTKTFNDIQNKLKDIFAVKYDNFPFGSPEKVLLNVSKDGGLWYKLEASIFKYKNTPVLNHNKYSFIKLARDIMPALSEFSFEMITSIDQILDGDLFTEISLNSDDLLRTISEGAGLSNAFSAAALINIDKIKALDYGTLFKVSCTDYVSGAGANSDPRPWLDGYYVFSNDAPAGATPIPVLSRISIGTEVGDLALDPGAIMKVNKVLYYNNIINFSNTIIPLSTNSIIIPGKIPFYVFNAQDTIEHYNESDRAATAVGTAIINKKALIIKNNQYYTVLELNINIKDSSIISLAANTSDTIVVFKPQSTKISKYPINAWGFEKEPMRYNAPESQFSTTSLGSYGDGSPMKNKEILSYRLQKNKLSTLYELLNNHENDRIKYNNMTIFTKNATDGVTTITPIHNSSGSIGYACSLKDIKDIFINQHFKFIKNPRMTDIEYDTLMSTLMDQVADIPDTSMQVMFIKCKDLPAALYSSTPNPGDVPSISNIRYGEITFDQDYIHSVPMNNLIQADINTISQRIQQLEVSNIALQSVIGKVLSTQNIINTGSIGDLEAHFNAIPDDPILCYQKSNSSNAACHKKLTKQSIYNKHQERNDLIKLLQNQSVQSTNTEGIIVHTAKPSNANIIPFIRVSVLAATADSNNTLGVGALKITYEDISDNYYWINIDPKQSCSIAEDMTVKVLLETKYKCSYLNATRETPDNNICPSSVGRSNTPNNGGVEDVIIIAGNPPVAPEMEIKYIIPSGVVTNQQFAYQRAYPAIARWDSRHIVERSFHINDDTDSGFEDILVEATEVYAVAMPCHLGIPLANIPASCIKNDGSSDVTAIGGAGPFGLLNSYNSRANKPTRVYNVFNLDDVSTLKVQFRKVPRQMRSIDYNATVYKYGAKGTKFRPSTAFDPPTELSIGQSLNNNFYIWECLQQNASGRLAYSTTPDFLKLQNEMIFRAFFGSVDGIENKQTLLQSLFAWEQIPYEYE